MRVHELAKELEMNSKELVAQVQEMGIEVKSHMSSLQDDQAEEIRKKFGGTTLKKTKKTVPAKKSTKKAAKKAAPTVSKKVSKETTQESEAQAPAEVSQEPSEETAQELIEKRVSTTVIRRRKKAKPEPVPQEPTPPAEDPQEAAVVPEQPAAKKKVKREAPAKEQKQETKEEPTDAQEPAEIPQETPREPETVATKEKVAPAQVIKKVKVREKEKTPARVIGRIEPEPTAEEATTAEAPQPQEATSEAVREKEIFVEDQGPEKGKRKSLREKQRRKFRWQKEELEDEEAEKPQTAFPHKRVRYKIKGKQVPRSKKQKADIIPLVQQEPEKTTPKAIKRKIRVHEGITVADLSKRMGVKATEVMKKLVELGVMATINQILDVDTASLVSSDFGYEIESVTIEEEVIFQAESKDDEKDLQLRCPVVTVMGHVDHGKTSLLDAIRLTNVVDKEQGGITQHIGAYRVSTKNGDIAFVDTPGHEAFTTMRARGAQVTDIVILVVAAEEGVKPQTVEAVNHAQAAEVPIIVAINKIDKPEANPEKARQELSQYGLVPEEWGGETIFVEVSAKTKQGIDKLLEMVLLQSEVLELKANPNKSAKGTIIEARLDRARGPIATVLVQEGTLRVGDSFVSRHNSGKVRALIDDKNRFIQEASPATPVEILGFSGVPEAGDVFIAVDEKKARQTSDYWQQKKREVDLRKDTKVTLENFLDSVEEAESKKLQIILKADVQGSAEALQQSLENLSTDEVKVNVIHNSVGAISLNDVMLASASNAIIIGFGVKTEPKVMDTAELENIQIRLYAIIYDVIDDVRKAMIGLLEPKLIEKITGKAEIRQVFDISKMGTVAGCMVVEGKIINSSQARVIRASEIIYEGKITSLKRFKDDAREVLSGQDCGIFLDNYKDFQEGDIIESFFLEEVERTL